MNILINVFRRMLLTTDFRALAGNLVMAAPKIFIYSFIILSTLCFSALGAPKLVIDKTSVNLGTIYKNPEGHPLPTTGSVTITNIGDQALYLAGDIPQWISPGTSYTHTVSLYEPELGSNSVDFTVTTNDPETPNLTISFFYEGVLQPDLIIEQLDGTPITSGGTILDLGPTTADDRTNLPVNFPTERTITIRLRNPGLGILPVKVNQNLMTRKSPPYTHLVGRSLVSGTDWYGADQSHAFDYRSIPPLGDITMSFTLKPTSDGTVVTKIPFTTSGRTYHSGVASETHSILLKTEATAFPRLKISPTYLFVSDIYKVHHLLPIEFSTIHQGKAELVTINVRNQGYAPMTLDADFIGAHPDDFAVNRALPITIEPETDAVIPIRFSPKNGGTRIASLRFTSDDPDLPQYVPLQGQGFRLVVEDPEGSNFGKVPVGGLATRTFALKNKGKTAISGISVELTSRANGQLSLIGEVPYSLEPGERVTFDVEFAPDQVASAFSYLKVTTLENLTEPLLLGITALGIDAPALELSSERGHISMPGETSMEVTYDSVDIGDYKRYAFDLKNQGTMPLNFSADFEADSSDDFSLLNPLPDSVSPGGRVRFEITFRPKDSGSKSAVFRIRSNDPDQPKFSMLLSGFGFPFSVETPEGTEFGTTEVGESEILSFVLINNGSEPLNNITALIESDLMTSKAAGVSAAAVVGSNEFTLVSPVPQQLAPRARVNFQVRFQPRFGGDRAVVLRLQNSKNRKQTLEIQLKGRGKVLLHENIMVKNSNGKNLSNGSAAVGFGKVEVGNKETRWFSIRNKGTKPLIVSKISVAGPHAEIFQIAGASNQKILPGKALHIQVSCKPVNAGEFSASFYIKSHINGVKVPAIRIKAQGVARRAAEGGKGAVSAGILSEKEKDE